MKNKKTVKKAVSRKKGTRKRFLYNPNNPKKSFGGYSEFISKIVKMNNGKVFFIKDFE